MGTRTPGYFPGLVGPVKVARYINTGQALKEDLLDRIAIAYDLPGTARVQRAVIGGKTAQKFEQLCLHEFSAPVCCRFVANRGDRTFPLVKLALRNSVEPEQKLVGLRRCRLGGQ